MNDADDSPVVAVVARTPLSEALSSAVVTTGAQIGPVDATDLRRIALVQSGADAREVRATRCGPRDGTAPFSGAIIAILSDPSHAERAIEAGADDVLVWPREQDLLGARLGLAARRHRAPPILPALFARLPDLVFRTSRDGRILDAYTGAGRFLQPRESFIGAHIDQIVPVEAARVIRSGYGAVAGGSTFATVTYRLPEGGIEQPYEARIVADGATDDVLAIVRPAPAHVPLGLDRATSEEIFRSVFEASGIGISVTLPGGGISEANPAFCHLLGYTAEELRGRHYLDFCHPDDVDVDRELRREIVAGTRDNYTCAKRYLTKDGHTLWTRLTVSVVRARDGGIQLGVGMIEDRSVRRRAERALRASEARLRVVVESAHNLVYEWALETGTMRYFEAATDARFPTHALPRTRTLWMAAVHPEDRARVALELDAHIERRTPFAIAYRIAMSEGDWRWVIDRGCALGGGAGAGPRRVVGACTDETDRRRLEERLVQSEKMEAVGRLAGGIAHDFNNLLVAIINHLDFALDALEPGQVRRDLEDARLAADRAAGLTRQILTFGRRQALLPRPVALNKLVARMMRMLRRVVGTHIRFVFKPGADLWPVHADPAQLEQILINLCANARDAMPDGGRLTLATANAALPADNHLQLPVGDYVRLEVSDVGRGIPPETLPRIFDPFFTTKARGQGTGLGLPMVYGIVQQHGGEIEAETAPDRGTTMRLFLPRTEAVERAGDRSHDDTISTRRAGGATILLAEDDEQVRKTTVRLLVGAGHRVIAASDGVEVVELFQAHREAVDVVLLDVVMPRASGRQAYERIRRLSDATPIAFMSGYSTEILDAGFLRDQPLLLKPFARDRLLSFVEDALARAARPRSTETDAP